MNPTTLFLQIATRQTEAELLGECPSCGALTYTPLAYAWQARTVLCGECGTKLPIDEDTLRRLGAQASEVAAEIERLTANSAPSGA